MVFLLLVLCVGLVVVLGIGLREYNHKLSLARGHGDVVVVEKVSFHESSKQLDNPNRGFYYMHGFRIKDEESDFRQNVADRFCRDESTNLTMIQFNLQEYRDKPITEEGLANLERLFEALSKIDKQIIVRFLYDWHGENKEYEPEGVDIILKHMEQVGPVLHKYQDNILVMQGLFIGNWGEMNGTKYTNAEDIKLLSEKLAEVTPDKMYLSVRMPMFWRMATGFADLDTLVLGDGSLSTRLGLYNDGMLGSWSDYGTYGNHTRAEHGDFTYWNREEELAFQEELCKYVPNGGETIIDNEYNDWENAISDLRRMHITYLNKDFDKNVLNKWAATTVKEAGCFDGMDGLTYVERHLGYRLLIKDTELQYSFDKDALNLQVELANVGFAPLYKEAEVRFLLYQEETGELLSYLVDEDIRKLSGGNDTEETLVLNKDIALAGKTDTTYVVYLSIMDTSSKKQLLLGNEEEPEKYGYRMGEITLKPIDEKVYLGQNTYCEKLFTRISAVLDE